MKNLPKIGVFDMMITLLLFHFINPAAFNNHFFMIMFPATLWLVNGFVEIPYNAIKRKWKNRNAKPQEKEDWNKRLEEIRKVQPPKPMKFNR